MIDDLPPEWREAMAAAPANRVDLVTLELVHPAFLDGSGNPVSIRAVHDTQDRTFTLEAGAPLNAGQAATFTAIPFSFGWPSQAEGQTGEVSIKIDNIGREIMPYAEDAAASQSPLQIIIRLIVVDLTAGTVFYAGTPFKLVMRDITIADDAVQGRASGADLANIQTLRLAYDLQQYPGLAYASGY